MNEWIRQVIERKRAWRRQMARLPVGEKLRVVEQMIKETQAIAASRPPKPANPVRRRHD